MKVLLRPRWVHGLLGLLRHKLEKEASMGLGIGDALVEGSCFGQAISACYACSCCLQPQLGAPN